MGNVPGWPVNVACESLNKTFGQLELLDAVHEGYSLNPDFPRTYFSCSGVL